MTQEDIIRMAESCGIPEFENNESQADNILCFAALVAAAEREKVARWMIERGYATGHGDSTEDMLQELDWQIAENWNRALINGITTEREACAKVCDDWPNGRDDVYSIGVAIRARGNT